MSTNIVESRAVQQTMQPVLRAGSALERLELRHIRALAYPFIILPALAIAWSSRHIIFSDGISYLQIATAYLNRDWPNAINAYWSPLYSWLIAFMLWLIKPSAYWQPAMLHLVNLLAYLASFLSLEFFLRELLHFLKGEKGAVSRNTFYIAGYAMLPFAALFFIPNPTPDEVASVLTILLMALILRVRRTSGSDILFAGVGMLCGLLFLTRAGFIASIPICEAVVLVLVRERSRRILRPALIMAACTIAVTGPFVAAVSHKEGRFTISESGKLTYAWEVDDAPRFMFWEGEPRSLGTATHPAKQISASPAAYLFDGPIGGAYPPWLEPHYWYAGIRPYFNLRRQLWAVAINGSNVLRLIFALPVLFAILLFILFTGIRRWWRATLSLWLIWVTVLTAFTSYCLVYVEKRYIIPNLLMTWLLLLASIRLYGERGRQWANFTLQTVSVLFLAFFIYRYVRPSMVGTLGDVVQGKERDKNLHYLLADRLRHFGLHEGDKVVYIGEALNWTEWARVAHVKVIGEVPILWRRSKGLFDNRLTEDPIEIHAFWDASTEVQKRILATFAQAGAVMAVTDGFYQKQFPLEWHQILSPQQIGKQESKYDLEPLLRGGFRYLRLQ